MNMLHTATKQVVIFIYVKQLIHLHISRWELSQNLYDGWLYEQIKAEDFQKLLT